MNDPRSERKPGLSVRLSFDCVGTSKAGGLTHSVGENPARHSELGDPGRLWYVHHLGDKKPVGDMSMYISWVWH